MQCRSYGTLAGEEFLHHALNLLAEASLIEIETEYILAGIEILQARVVLISLASEDGSNGFRLSSNALR